MKQIDEEAGLEPGELRRMEQHYHRVGEDNAALQKVAAYYGVPLEKLQWHRERFRKAFSVYLEQGLITRAPIRVHMRTDETLSGRVRWWDLGAFGLEPEDGKPLTVVQRHAVLDWDETLSNEQVRLHD